jgi:hypothetical protein
MTDYWYAVVRKHDGKIRALFDISSTAYKWCNEWNEMSPQNPYFVVENFAPCLDMQAESIPWIPRYFSKGCGNV